MRHRAFTLMELLVVITILALLMTLSVSVLSGVRQRARTVACRANIRSLLMSLQQYDAAHGMLPYGFDFEKGRESPRGYMGDARYELPGWWWYHFAGVVSDRSQEVLKVLRCPSSRLDDPMLDRDPLCGKYGVNRALCKGSPDWARSVYKKNFVGRPLSLDDLGRPGSTLLLADSGYSLICWWNASAEPPVTFNEEHYIEDTAYVPGLAINKDKYLRPGQTTDAIGGRHPSKTVNVGFADGHAELKPAGELLVEKVADGQYTNTFLWQGR
jgi:prepilin-type N-terminal cleavage/methylation domain-containing protein/prepilin-type processing-associated H-X9-DG protein